MSIVLFFKGHNSLFPFTVKNIISAPNQIVEMGQIKEIASYVQELPKRFRLTDGQRKTQKVHQCCIYKFNQTFPRKWK